MLVYRIERREDGIGPFEAMGRPEVPGFNVETLGPALGWVKIEMMDSFETYGPIAFFADLPPMVPTLAPDAQHPHHNTDVQMPPDEFDAHTWKVGCKSKEQLDSWFPHQSYELLRRYGFVLSIYDCTYFHMGSFQLLFCVDNAKLVERKELV